MKKASALILVLAAVASAAKVKPAGDIYGYFSDVISDPDSTRVGYNEFGIGRAYLSLKAEFVEDTAAFLRANARITYDIEPMNKLVKVTPDPADSTPPVVSISTAYAGFLKYAYGEVGYSRGMPGQLWIKLGQVQTPWIENEEHLWLFRGVQKVLVDRVGLMSSADRGLVVEYDFPSGYGSAYASYMNGEGYKSGEVNGFKDMAGRLSIFPLAGTGNPALSGLGIHGYYQMGKPGENLVRDRMIAGASCAMGDRLGFMGQYVMARNGDSGDPTESSGYSAWLWVDLGRLVTGTRSFGLMGRYDQYDPNADASDDASSFILAGLYYNLARGWTASLSYQAESPENSSVDPSSSLYLHFIGKF
jgi:hypothetical protein